MPTLTTRQQRAAASKRRTVKVIFAVIGSLILHFLIVLAVLWIVPHWPKPHYQGKPMSGPLRLQILPPDSPTPPPSGPADAAHPQYMRTTDSQKSDTTPTDPNFISDKDTLAAAEQPAAGDKPLPTQQGRESEEFDFDTTQYRPGKTAQDAASNAPAPQSQAQTQQEQKTETPAPSATPLPKKSRPRRQDTNQATPVPNGELAMNKAEPSATPEPPAPTPEKPEDETANTPPKPTQRQNRSESAAQSNPSIVQNQGPVKPPGYQPMTRQTKAVGSINNRGKPAVQAIGTPLGRYIKTVQDSIGALWYYRTEEKMDLLSTGQVKINFFVERNGHTARVKVISGSQNSALSSVSTGAVMEADIPPIPDEVAALLPGGEMEMELGFDMY